MDGPDQPSFSAYLRPVDSLGHVAVNHVLGVLPDIGYGDRVTHSFDVQGDDLLDDVRRAANRVSDGGHLLCYVAGKLEVKGDDLLVAGQPSTGLRELLSELTARHRPAGLVVLLDHVGEPADRPAGLHSVAIGALADVVGDQEWCLLSACSGASVDETTFPLLAAAASELFRRPGGHQRRWLQASDLLAEARAMASTRGCEGPLFSASSSTRLRIGCRERGEAPPLRIGLELALSGGGYRASAFSLGALLYLVHAELNKQVDSIVSVSGGSITNGWVAQQCNYSKVCSVEEFAPVVGRLVDRIAKRSLASFSNRFLVSWAVALAIPLVALVIVIWGASPWGWVDLALSAVLLAAVATVVHLRGLVISAWLAESFFKPDRHTAFAVLGRRAVDHVFCATELVTGSPMFFSTRAGGRIFNEQWGLRPFPAGRLSTVVRASSALPPFLPPIRLRMDEAIVAGTTRTRAPVSVWLSDGGVWNNLGTDWSRLRQPILDAETKRHEQQGMSDVDAFMAVLDGYSAPSGGLQIVVDSSGPVKTKELSALRWPMISSMVNLYRTLSVSYASTVVGRLPSEKTAARDRMLQNPELWWIDYPQGPTWNAQPGSAAPVELVVRRTRPGAIASVWDIVGLGDHWKDLKARYKADLEASPEIDSSVSGADEIRTTLNGLGRVVTAGLVVDGYLATRETLVSALERHRPPPLPDASWFDDVLMG